MGAFETAWLARQGDLDAAFAEPDGFTVEGLTPSTRPDGKTERGVPLVSDPARPKVQIVAIFDDLAADRYPDARGHSSSDSVMMSASQPKIDFVSSLVPYRPRLHDRVIRLRTGDRYEVADIDTGTPGRTTLRLTAKAP